MNILSKILKEKKDEISKLKQRYTLNSFTEMEFFQVPSSGFKKEVNRNNNISIIAEVKRASPSKGIIKENFNHLEIACKYFENRVNAVSVLTDKHFFKGDIQFLIEIAKVKTAPLLRKDFIIDEFQVYESKAFGADFILLICEALSENQIKELSLAASEIDLEVLLELHSESQLEKVDFGLNSIIGVNNRNLENFSVDLGITYRLSKLIPDEVILVSESGINKQEDIEYLIAIKIDAVLVGEHLIRSPDIVSSLQQLKKWCLHES